MKRLRTSSHGRDLRLEPLEKRMLLSATPLANDTDSSLLLQIGLAAQPIIFPDSELIAAATDTWTNTNTTQGQDPVIEPAAMSAGTWTAAASLAPSGIGTMMLLSDGRVMAQGGGVTKQWYQLAPNANGSYLNGTWSPLAPMGTERLYFGSNVLRDGRIFLVGGEYSGPAGTSNWTNTGEIYDPVANTWSTITPFPQSNFGDAPTEILPDGRVLAGYLSGPQTYIYDPATNTWSAGGTKLRGDGSSEETWSLLPDGSILSYDIFSSISFGVGHAQRYVPSLNTWVDAGNLPALLSTPTQGYEFGPQMLLPDGRVFAVGANNQTALYTPSTNTWAAGPSLPVGMGADDAPAAELPNGHVIFAADTPLFNPPTVLYDFDPATNSLSQLTGLPAQLSADLASPPSFTSRMLMLPTGQLAYTTGNGRLWIFTPSDSPIAASRPTISSITSNGDGTFTLTGTQLNGISEGASYGDDAEMSSNYPIVRLTDGSNQVFYARTYNWSSTGVATGNTPVTTQFAPPAGLPNGTYSLQVIANGIASTSVPFVKPFILSVINSTPAAGSVLATAPTDFSITLSEPYDPSTVQAADLTVNGVPADSVTQTDAVTLTFHYITSPVTTQGLQTMSVAAGSIQRNGDLGLIDAFTGNFRYDLSPITVTATVPANAAAASLPLTDFLVTFSEPYSPASIDTSDLTLSHGLVTGFTLVDSTTVAYHVSLSVESTINFSIAAGAVTDVFGNSGPAYAGSFTTDVSTIAFPNPIVAVAPLGSQVYRASYSGLIGSNVDSDSFTLALDPGQTLAVTVRPDGNLKPRIDVSGPGVTTSASAAVAGGVAVVQSVAISGGTYTITVSGLDGTTGAYTLTPTLNAAVEAEQFTGASDDLTATAQDLNVAFVDIGNGGSRAAAVGTGDLSLPNEIETNDSLATANDASGSFRTYTGNLYQLGIKGSVGALQDQDWYNIGQLHTGDIITITLSGTGSNRGTLTDSLVGLFHGPTLSAVEIINDSYGPGMDAFIYRFRVVSTGTYYIDAGRFDLLTGTYDLGVFLESLASPPLTGGTLTAEVEPNDTGVAANDASTSWRPVQYISTVSAEITAGDVDVYRYQFTAGSLLTIDAASTGGFHPRVTLLNAAGTPIALEDGTSVGLTTDSPVYAYIIPSTDTYYVEVQSVSGTGDYALNMYLSSNTVPPFPTTTFDTYAFSLTAGDTVSLATKGLSGASPNLSLLNSAGTVIAVGSAGATNLDQLINSFAITAPGTYYARVGPNNPFEYNLVVTRNAAFDAQPNASLAAAQSLAPAAQVLGFVDGTGSRNYRLQLIASQAVTLRTTTPGDGIGLFANSLDPAVDLYDLNGVLLASNDNGGPDGRNSLLMYTPTSSGAYVARVRAAAGQGEFVFNAAGTDTTISSSIVDRKLFYNQSGTSTRYDHNDLAINSFDDLAIATDKTAYLWEDAGAATFANVSSFTKGINGIMVDISGSHPNISADDFIFRVGNNNSPGAWATANAPTSISVRAGAGTGGSDRVTIIWNGATAPIKQWLEVIVLANADTGLSQKVGHPAGHGDAFFFGNAPGNTGTGDTVANALVTAADESAIRANNALVGANIPITNIYDVGRNASVSALDESAARLNGTNPTTTLKYLNLTSAPAAPEADGVDALVAGDSGDSGVASALTAPALSNSEGGVPKWLTNRIEQIDLNTGSPARLFQYLHDANTPRSRALLQKFDSVADALGLDDELLDSLLADLP